MEKLEYKKYVYSLLTQRNKIKLNIYAACPKWLKKHHFFDKKDMMKVLVRFHKSIIFSDEENYYNVLKSDYKNYLADKSEYYKDLMKVIEETKRQRATGEFFQHEYYLCCFKFVGYNNGYEYLNKEVKEEYKPFINAGNSGIYGRLPICFDMEQEIINGHLEFCSIILMNILGEAVLIICLRKIVLMNMSGKRRLLDYMKRF